MILGVVFCSPSRHLFTEILFCTLIDTDREIDTDRHQENSVSGTLRKKCKKVEEVA